MGTFSTIRVKTKIANRFRKFSVQVARTHTEAMESMLNFFDWKNLSPNDDMGSKNERTNRRINALIAIIKNIEKHQTKPTEAMLRTLFEEVSKNEKEEDTFNYDVPKLISEHEELAYYRKSQYTNQENYNALKYDIENIINKTKYVNSNFGTGYFRLEIGKEEFEQFKRHFEKCTSP